MASVAPTLWPYSIPGVFDGRGDACHRPATLDVLFNLFLLERRQPWLLLLAHPLKAQD
jgi:hypothetical protein